MNTALEQLEHWIEQYKRINGTPPINVVLTQIDLLKDYEKEQCNIDLVMLSREQIAKQMGWDDYAEMMLNEDNIESITKGAINMIFIAYKLKIPFD